MNLRVPPFLKTSRRPSLLVLVYGVSLVLVLAVAAVLVTVVGDHIRSSAIDSSVAADRSLARSFAYETDHSSFLSGTITASTTASINADLAELIDPVGSGIVQIKVYDPDGTVRFSNKSALVGRQSGIDEGLGEAIDGRSPVVEIRPANGPEESTLGRTGNVVEEYLPILDAAGNVTNVFEVYRDAAPIISKVDAARDDVLRLTALAALVLGVLLYLIFRTAHRRLALQTKALLAAEHQDALTGLLDHGAIVARLVEQLETVRSAKVAGAVGVAIVDVDNFRLVNDTHGHAAGDTALREVARMLTLELSQASILGRYGPDEFLIVAPPQCAHDLEAAIGRLRTRLADLSLQFGVSERLPVTVSAGICFAPVNGDAATELLSVATVTLGEAKAGGGDRIHVAESGDEPARAFDQSSFDVLQGLVLAVDT
ncbi:MAG TPA: GGDEF domain-containing protein, partial [Candidatus Acidoferrum sp.]|nr:GGDEF domain-containing protein [Candidatus Acidoferrum sp.]